MTFQLVLFHTLLACLLFFFMNWIGGHATVAASYYPVSYFSRYDEAPAFNILFRVLTPVVYVVVVAAVLYSLGLAEFVSNIYLVVAYHALIRWGYNLVMGRKGLVRWGRQLATAGTTLTIAYLAYQQIVSNPSRLLPDFATMANEVWIIIILFVYKLFEQIKVAPDANQTRKFRFLRDRYDFHSQRFGLVVNQEVQQLPKLEPLVYAVLIYETFNRPTVVQWLERYLFFPLGLARSLGPMQVQTDREITDLESVRTGTRLLVSHYGTCLEQVATSFAAKYGTQFGDSLRQSGEPSHIHRDVYVCAVTKFNIRSDYPQEVLAIHDFLLKTYYPHLLPKADD